MTILRGEAANSVARSERKPLGRELLHGDTLVERVLGVE